MIKKEIKFVRECDNDWDCHKIVLDNKEVGTFHYHKNEGYILIHKLNLKKYKMDRKGYGTKIIEELVRWLGEGFIFVNYPKVVYEDLTPDAKEFYLKCGFQSFKEDYKDDEDYGNFYDKAIFLLDEIEQADGDLLYLQAYEGCL